MTSFVQPYGTGTVLSGQTAGNAAAQQRADSFFSSPSPSGFWDNSGGGAGGGGGAQISAVGAYGQIAGALMSAVGGYFSALAKKDQLKSQALSAEFQAFMSQMNARQAEEDAQAILAAGRSQIGMATMQRGQEKSRRKVSAAARGVVGNVGSAAEVLATEDLMKEIEAMTINQNTVRAAGQARMQGVNYGNQSLLSGVSAGNLRRTAGSISPGLAASTSLGNSARSFISPGLAASASFGNSARSFISTYGARPR